MNTDFDNETIARSGWISTIYPPDSLVEPDWINPNTDPHVGITALLVHCATVSSALSLSRSPLSPHHRGCSNDPEDRRRSRSAAFDTRDDTKGAARERRALEKGRRERGGGKKRRQRGGGRETDRREGGTTEREKKRERLSTDAADSTTGGGGLTAPLHIHPRYIDLSRPPPSSRLTSPLATLLYGTRAHQERSVESVPGAAALVSAIRRGWGIGDGSGGGRAGGGEGSRGGGGDDGGGGAELT